MGSEWKPWYEEVAGIHSPAAREEFMRDKFGGPGLSAGRMASNVVTAGLMAYGVNRLLSGFTSRRRGNAAGQGQGQELQGLGAGDDAADARWTAMFAEFAKVEPDLRLMILRIDRFLDESGERGTDRARRLDRISGLLDGAFEDLRAAMFARDVERCQEVILSRIQPSVEELRSLFGHEDVDPPNSNAGRQAPSGDPSNRGPRDTHDSCHRPHAL
jgi:hypothetical protein